MYHIAMRRCGRISLGGNEECITELHDKESERGCIPSGNTALSCAMAPTQPLRGGLDELSVSYIGELESIRYFCGSLARTANGVSMVVCCCCAGMMDTLPMLLEPVKFPSEKLEEKRRK